MTKVFVEQPRGRTGSVNRDLVMQIISGVTFTMLQERHTVTVQCFKSIYIYMFYRWKKCQVALLENVKEC